MKQIFTLLSLFCLAGVLQAEDAKPTKEKLISYYDDVRPIFQANCQGCHQPAKQGGEYVMTNFQQLLKGGESGEPALVADKPDESYLVKMLIPTDGEAEMPKGKPALSETDRNTISTWIAQGAKDNTPASAITKYDMDHPPAYELPPVLTSVDYSPDGKTLAVSGYHEVLLHKADGSGIAARLVGMSERIEAAKFSPDGKFLAVAGGSPGRLGELQIWSLEKNELLHAIPVSYDTIYGASWSPDGKLIAVGCGDNTVRAFEMKTGKQVMFSGAHNDWALDTSFTNDGKHVMSVGRDMTVKLTEVATQRFIDNITSITPGALKGGLSAVDTHPKEDQILIGGADGVPKIYRIFREKARKIGDDFNLIRKFPQMPGRIYDVAFNHDATQIVACSSFNGTGSVQLFNAADGKLVFELEGHQEPVYSVTFSPNGKQIASVGFDGLVHINDTTTGKLIRTFSSVPTTAEVAGK
ncbi:MAG: hypothetical protein COA78_25500 [Blastopirellula sp.]|nr:MAG: hypothetical protein COA78_25500 [Blastopirellula sp.]